MGLNNFYIVRAEGASMSKFNKEDNMVSPARFELTASELGILRSILLSYEDKSKTMEKPPKS